MGVFIAWWIKLFFKRYSYNYFEILILLCFVMGMAMLIIAVFAIAEGLLKVKLMEIGGYACVVYCAWAIAGFFDKSKVMSYVKSLTAYLLGMITFTLMAFLAGSLLGVFYRH